MANSDILNVDDLVEVINDAKAVEEGRQTIDQMIHSSDKEVIRKKLNKVTDTIISALEQAQDSDHPILNELLQDAKVISKIPLPIEKDKYPYTSAILLFQCKQQTLVPHQEKSVYADTFPGTIPKSAQVANNEIVNVNFDYADLAYLRMLVAPGNWKSTGLYAPAGSVITIELPENTKDLDIQVGAHTDQLGHLLKWDRAPIVTFRETLKAGVNQISSPFGGLIYLIPTKSKSGKDVNITINGAVKAPYFVLGETDINEWNETIKNYPAPWAEFQGKHVIHTVPSSVIEEMDSPETLLHHWDDMIEQYNKLVGLKKEGQPPHRIPDRQHRITSDIQISAGYMHAGYPIMIPNEPAALHTVQFDRVKDLNDGWGFWHEMGHEYQQVAWFWDDIVEVSVNIYSLYMQDYFGNPSRLLTKDKNGQTYYDIAFAFLNNEDTDKNFNQIGLFERLVMIRQLQMAYDWNFFTNLHVAYRELPEEDLPDDNNEQQKIDKFVAMSSKVSGENLLDFFSLWGMPYTAQAKMEVEAMNLPNPKIPLWTLIEEGESPK